MNEQKEKEDRIAVLIDFENIGLNTIQKLFEQLATYGKIALKRPMLIGVRPIKVTNKSLS